MRFNEFAPSFRASFGDVPSFSTLFGQPALTDPDAPTDKTNAGVGLNPNAKSGQGLDPTKTGGIGLKVGKSAYPVDGPISSGFGMRARGQHNGTDFAVPVGTPIKAPDAGVISRAGHGQGGEGTYIVLDAGGTVHKFFHLSKIEVQPGQQVKKGQLIGLTGNTGLSTGPHLHWEKHIAGRPVDPMSNIG